MSSQRKLVFYGAISADGYLARENHSLDWLIGTEGEEDTDYADFYESVDTIIMGRKTYEEILVLLPEEFPYKGKECFVFSRTLTGSSEDVQFIHEDTADFIRRLKRQEANGFGLSAEVSCCTRFWRKNSWMSLSFRLLPFCSAGEFRYLNRETGRPS